MQDQFRLAPAYRTLFQSPRNCYNEAFPFRGTALHTDKLLIQKCSLHEIHWSELHDIEAPKEGLNFMLPVHARPHVRPPADVISEQ